MDYGMIRGLKNWLVGHREVSLSVIPSVVEESLANSKRRDIPKPAPVLFAELGVFE